MTTNVIRICGICRVGIDRSEAAVFNSIVECDYCRAYFHKNHMEIWLTKKLSCPSCKEDFTETSDNNQSNAINLNKRGECDFAYHVKRRRVKQWYCDRCHQEIVYSSQDLFPSGPTKISSILNSTSDFTSRSKDQAGLNNSNRFSKYNRNRSSKSLDERLSMFIVYCIVTTMTAVIMIIDTISGVEDGGEDPGLGGGLIFMFSIIIFLPISLLVTSITAFNQQKEKSKSISPKFNSRNNKIVSINQFTLIFLFLLYTVILFGLAISLRSLIIN